MLLWDNSDQIHNLFDSDVQYQVPRYQRRYVWDETNWRTLWEDILLQEELEAENRGHFTGNIVTRSISRGHLRRFEVIDGQQRLATFQTILCIIRDICLSQDSDELKELADEVNGLIVNSAPAIKRSTSDRFPDPTYKFHPTDYDRSAFDAVAEGKYGKVIPQAFDEAENCLKPDLVEKVRSQVFCGPNASSNILDAYDYFYVQIRDYVGTDYDYGKVGALIISIKFDFNLIQITLGSSDQPEKIFESLNATGRMLSEFDYLRNNLFLRAGKLGKDENGRSYSDIFYDKYWIFENDSQYWSTERLDNFFQGFLIAELGPESEGKNLKSFDRYRNYSKKLTEEQGQDVKYELYQLKCYADSYKEISDPNSDIGCQMQFYNNLNLPSLDSFILFLKHKLKLNDDLLHGVCCILESYIMRQLLCAERNKTSYAKIESYERINTLFFQAIEDCKFSVGDFAEGLHGTWPNSEQVRKALEQAWSKDDNLILYILYRIELHKRELSGRTYKPLGFKDLETSERIKPPRAPLDYYAADSIGNIIPLINAFGNGWDELPFEEKKWYIEDDAKELILLQEICEYDNWSTEEINCRVDDLIDSFSLIWPPASSY